MNQSGAFSEIPEVDRHSVLLLIISFVFADDLELQEFPLLVMAGLGSTFSLDFFPHFFLFSFYLLGFSC